MTEQLAGSLDPVVAWVDDAGLGSKRANGDGYRGKEYRLTVPIAARSPFEPE